MLSDTEPASSAELERQSLAGNCQLRYCFVTYGALDRGATYVRAMALARELSKRGYRVFVMADSLPANKDILTDSAFEAIFVDGADQLTRLANRRRALKTRHIDAVHLLNPIIQNCLLVAGNGKLKVVVDWDEPPTFRQRGRFAALADSVQEAWMARRVDVPVACNRALEGYLGTRYKLAPLYIPHAIEQAKVGRVESTEVREPVGVYMGTFYPVWDYDLVFDALLLLAKQGLFPRVEFIGDGPDLERWRNFLARFSLHNILLSGYLSDDEMKRRLRSAHYLLFPIRDTPFNQTRCPSKLFAYAQSQRPILTNHVGEVPEILGNSPIYLPATADAFADTIHRFSVSPRKPDVDYKISRHTYMKRVETLDSEMSRLGWVSKS